MIDGRRCLPGQVLRTDVCVVGSGPAGTTVAEELARHGHDVLVVEGGGPRNTAAGVDTLRGRVADGEHEPLEAVRQKRLGGASGQWGGRCAPLDPSDLAPTPWRPGWPLDPADLEPWYRRADTLLDAGTGGYRVEEAWPRDPVPCPPGSVLRWDRLWRWSPPTRHAGRLTALEGRGEVRVLARATVTRFDRDPVGGAVVSATASPRRGVEITVEAAHFVLAAGGLESARLLLTSDRQSPAGIGNEHDQVGRCYMTHPVAEVGALDLLPRGRALVPGYARTVDGTYSRRMLELDAAFRHEHGLGALKVAPWYRDAKDPAHHDALLSLFAVVQFSVARGRLGFRSRAMHAGYARTGGFAGHATNMARDPGRIAHFVGAWTSPRLTGGRIVPSFMPVDRDALRLRFDAEQSPEPANRVVLDRDRDPLGMRRLAVHYRLSATDRGRLRRGLATIADEVTREGFGTVAVPDLQAVTDGPLLDGTHQMGLLRMSHSPRSGVVDADCRVHGCANLWVAGSAVFPTSGAVGPTPTIVALACRLADRLGREIGRPGSDRVRLAGVDEAVAHRE